MEECGQQQNANRGKDPGNRIVEHHALGRWGDDRLVSTSGDLFVVSGDSEIRGLPNFSAPDNKTLEMIEFYHRTRELLAGTGLDVTGVRLTERGAWALTLNRQIDVEIGSEQPLERLDRFVTSLDQLGAGAESNLASVDLRYGNGFAVRWNDEDVPAEGRLEAARYDVPAGESL